MRTMHVLMVAVLVLILVTLKVDADDHATMKEEKEPKRQFLSQTAFGRKAIKGRRKDQDELGESKKSSASGYMTDSENDGSDTINNNDNNSGLHLNNHHYFTDPRKLPHRN
ncbi:uncharacterized protein LOC129307846 [Prosopis cineraria]|uniref:uncharacterized protein LOC129307846 n=1 Tax=Prosopis cineraria TaxID=364024 RepID=UPI00240EDB5D|nr:uncharacterized protein LOC129307846 [Prosopis cineraria]